MKNRSIKHSFGSLLSTVALWSLGSLHAADAPAPAPAPDKEAWKSVASAGITLTRGNSETLLGTANINSEKKRRMNELGLGANAAYGEDRGIQNAGSVGAFSQYNRLISDRLFAYARVDLLHDSIADVDYRVGLSPGLGYYVIKNDRHSLRAEVGPGYVLEKLGGQDRSYLTLRVAERYELKINERARLWQSAEFMPRVEEFEDYVLNFEIGVSTDITQSFGLRVFAQDTYRSRPAFGRDKNDLKLVAGVEYKF